MTPPPLDVGVGGVVHTGERARQVVGIVENPLNLSDEFVLVPVGQATPADHVSFLANATEQQMQSFHPRGNTDLSVQSGTDVSTTQAAAIMLAISTIGMLFIGLLAVSGFAVMAQRRLRALGMLESIGATDRHVRLVMLANGAVVGLVSGVGGAALGLIAWLRIRTASRGDPAPPRRAHQPLRSAMVGAGHHHRARVRHGRGRRVVAGSICVAGSRRRRTLGAAARSAADAPISGGRRGPGGRGLPVALLRANKIVPVGRRHLGDHDRNAVPGSCGHPWPGGHQVAERRCRYAWRCEIWFATRHGQVLRSVRSPWPSASLPPLRSPRLLRRPPPRRRRRTATCATTR